MYSDRPMDSMDGTLYYCTNEYSDENTVGATWTIIGYCTGFDVSKNQNQRDVYNKRTKTYTAYGRNEYTGTMNALFTLSSAGISKICGDGLPVALKFVVDKGSTGVVCETRYFSNVNLKNLKESYGNPNEGGDCTVSCDFSFEDDHWV